MVSESKAHEGPKFPFLGIFLRTARGEGDGRDYSEVRARAPNGSQEVAARVRGGHVTARTRIGVQLGRLIDTVRRSRKEAG